MTIKGVVFDMDGTLVDNMGICEQSLQETITHFAGQPLPEAVLTTHYGPTEEGILYAVLGERNPSAYSHLLNIYEQMHSRGLGPVFPGVFEMLEELRAQGMRLAIATGKGAETAEISLRYTGLAPYVERVETGFLECGDKPRLIRRVLEGWGMPPAQAAYVGDTPSDMVAARQAGVLPLGAAWAERSPLRMNGAAQEWNLFYHVKDFSEWIKNR